jgi:flagellar hook-associated protein 2
MATVGLSFGNPTGGTGFDVTATVSQIMAGYQAVETPWNTQLTTLASQDAAFSTIGNDLSTLSAAVGVLTNFQGVLASKEGSSSNPNVLALTGASTSAVAGSHTVAVTQLAQTSAWSTSSTPMTATETFNGSFTIAVGSGTAQTINATGDTLSTLAASINSAQIGVTASVLTDSAGSYLSLVSGTSGAAGALTVNGSSSTSSSTLTYGTGTGTAVTLSQSLAGQDAVMIVDGNSVTSSSNTVTSAIPGVTFQLLDTTGTTAAPGTPVQVQITNNTADVASAMDTFVSAYNAVISALNVQEGNNSSGTPEPLFGNSSLALLQEQLAGAANMSQNSVWSSSGTPIAATDQLAAGSLSIQVGSGTAVSIPVNAGDTLSSLASTINNTKSLGVTASVITGTTGSYLSLESNAIGSAGDLTVTGSLTDTTKAGTIGFADTNVGSSINSLAALGIGVTGNGTLSVDTNSLSTVLNQDYQSIVNFFQDASSVGMNFSNVISTLGTSSPTGIITEALAQNSQQESSLNTDITNENAIISAQQVQLTAELEQANLTLQSIPSQINMMNELYSAITGYGATQS